MKYSAVILAAGKGVRMRSELPKVVHRAAGKPLICHVIEAVREAGIDKIIVVIGHGREAVKNVLTGYDVDFALQEEQLGTGHALMQARHHLSPSDHILVLAGDTPLLKGSTLRSLIDFHQEKAATAAILSCEINDPYGYGRIVRSPDWSLQRIVEEKDASVDEKKIKEINSGIYCFKCPEIFRALEGINTSNAQGEYYLTDALTLLNQGNHRVEIYCREIDEEIIGVNDRLQLAGIEALLRKRKNIELMRQGVTMVDPASTFIDNDVIIGSDTIILPFTIIEGQTVIGNGCEIGPASRISDSSIGNNVIIETSRIKQAQVADWCTIGPYAYLRPGAELGPGVKVGDFVEIKKSIIGENSKVPHLSYVGDALIGKGVNVGAGTITCNYDGKNKHQTILEDGVFIGSNTNLIAPVTIGENSVTGAGSSITRNVPPNSLAVERADQKIILRRGNKS